ncbi:hypothetical protein U9M48_020835, partial [Paspalum notatum var. saurae]
SSRLPGCRSARQQNSAPASSIGGLAPKCRALLRHSPCPHSKLIWLGYSPPPPPESSVVRNPVPTAKLNSNHHDDSAPYRLLVTRSPAHWFPLMDRCSKTSFVLPLPETLVVLAALQTEAHSMLCGGSSCCFLHGARYVARDETSRGSPPRARRGTQGPLQLPRRVVEPQPLHPRVRVPPVPAVACAAGAATVVRDNPASDDSRFFLVLDLLPALAGADVAASFQSEPAGTAPGYEGRGGAGEGSCGREKSAGGRAERRRRPRRGLRRPARSGATGFGRRGGAERGCLLLPLLIRKSTFFHRKGDITYHYMQDISGAEEVAPDLPVHRGSWHACHHIFHTHTSSATAPPLKTIILIPSQNERAEARAVGCRGARGGGRIRAGGGGRRGERGAVRGGGRAGGSGGEGHAERIWRGRRFGRLPPVVWMKRREDHGSWRVEERQLRVLEIAGRHETLLDHLHRLLQIQRLISHQRTKRRQPDVMAKADDHRHTMQINADHSFGTILMPLRRSPFFHCPPSYSNREISISPLCPGCALSSPALSSSHWFLGFSCSASFRPCTVPSGNLSRRFTGVDHPYAVSASMASKTTS